MKIGFRIVSFLCWAKDLSKDYLLPLSPQIRTIELCHFFKFNPNLWGEGGRGVRGNQIENRMGKHGMKRTNLCFVGTSSTRLNPSPPSPLSREFGESLMKWRGLNRPNSRERGSQFCTKVAQTQITHNPKLLAAQACALPLRKRLHTNIENALERFQH